MGVGPRLALRPDVEEAAVHARAILADPASRELGAGSSWAIVSLAEAHAGNAEASAEAWVQARRFLDNGESNPLLRWFERVREGGPWEPMPALHWAQAATKAWVHRDGTCFRSGDADPVELSRSPVSVALLAALASGPSTPDALIDTAWPDDASS